MEDLLSEGFFNLTKEYVGELTPNCALCGMDRKINTPRMKVSGKGGLKVFLLAESPGRSEDSQGVQLVGEAGELLRKSLKELGADLDRDFWKMNSCSCRPIDKKGNNRKPTSKEIGYCRPFWRATLQELKPDFIFLFGGTALEAFFGDRKAKVFNKLAITSWRKHCIPDDQTGAWVIPLLHPSYVIRTPGHEHVFKRDLKWAMSCLTKKPPEFPEYPVKLLTNFDELCQTLKDATAPGLEMSFDYETNCLRPYYEGAKLETIGFHIADQSYSFPYQWSGYWSKDQLQIIRELWTNLLRTNSLIVQALPMEESWNRYFFGDFRDRYIWDTQLTTHVLDEREHLTGLKKQAYLNFGVYGYDDEMDKWLKPTGKALFNNIEQGPLPKIMKYNGLDARFTYMLWEKQSKQLRPGKPLTDANHFFRDGLIDLLDMELEGLRLNIDHYKEQSDLLGQGIINAKDNIMEMEEVQVFKENQGREIDIASNKDLQILLFDIMGLQNKSKATKTGFAVNEAALNAIDVSFTQNIIKIRKLKKQRDYVDNFIFLSDSNGILRPHQNLHLASTYRSSSSSPNLHNLPKRNDESKGIVRTGIIPPDDYHILEVDYGAMEVRIWACYTKDPVLLQYLHDDHDMHKEWGEFFEIPRGRAKNLFVFPLIYGSYYVSIYGAMKEERYSHLTEDWVKEGQEKFWNKYSYCRKWQDNVVDTYQKTGVVHSKFGFLRRGLLSRNQIVNYPIQSAAFHCLLWSSIRISEIAKKEQWKTKKIGQIHDALLFYLYPDEKEHVMEVVERVMTKDVAEEFDWINVPLLSEFSISEIKGSWAKMTDIKRGN